MRYLLYPILLFLCVSCIQLGGEAQPTAYYLLQEATNISSPYSDKALNINIKLATFPSYLDRPQIVTQSRKNKIEFSSFIRWGEPLKENLTQTLRENLLLFFPNADISIGPWEHSDKDATQIILSVNDFSGELGQYSDVDIRWVIDADNGLIKRGHFTEQRPLGETHHDLVVELSNSLNRLGQELVNQLTNM